MVQKILTRHLAASSPDCTTGVGSGIYLAHERKRYYLHALFWPINEILGDSTNLRSGWLDFFSLPKFH
jgi:hypothetical protein